MAKGDLNKKQREFLTAYAANGFTEAGPTWMSVYGTTNKNSARVSACKLLRKPNAVAYLQPLREKAKEVVERDFHLAAVDVRQALLRQALADPLDAFEIYQCPRTLQTKLRLKDRLPASLRGCVQHVRVSPNGGVSVKLYDGQKAWMALGKDLGMWPHQSLSGDTINLNVGNVVVLPQATDPEAWAKSASNYQNLPVEDRRQLLSVSGRPTPAANGGS